MLRERNEIIVPIFAPRAFRGEREASPIQCFVPCLLPAAFARGVVIERNNEGLAAVVCPEHELSSHSCSGATDDRKRLTSTPDEAMVAQGVNGRLDCNYAIRPGEISNCKPGGELISKARAEGRLMFGIPKSGSAHLAMLVAVKENKARIGPVIIGVDRTASM